jgi:hypothetical protein
MTLVLSVSLLMELAEREWYAAAISFSGYRP